MALLSTMANSDGATSIGATSRRCKRSVPLRGAAKFGATSIGATSRRCKDRCCVEARRKVRCYCDRCNFEVLQRSVPLRGTVKFGATSIGATSRRCKDRCRLEALQGSVPLRGSAKFGATSRHCKKISTSSRRFKIGAASTHCEKCGATPRHWALRKLGAISRHCKDRCRCEARQDRCRFGSVPLRGTARVKPDA